MTRKGSSIQVECTNDYSIQSKYSSHLKNYVEDEFIKHFIIGDKKRKYSRTPLINRGYYIRFKAIEWGLCKTKPDTVVSLGTGFDTSALRHLGMNFIEIDLPFVAKRKSEIICENELLSDVTLYEENHGESSSVILRNSRYSLIAGDLRDHKKLSELVSTELRRFSKSNHRVSILNECCLCYITEVKSNNVISRIVEAIKRTNDEVLSVSFVSYEMIKPPSDHLGFPAYMLRHFASMGSPLKTFLTKVEQIERFRSKLKFDSVEVYEMTRFFETLVDPVEKHRLNSIEPFDEFEEFDLLSSCYALTIAEVNFNRDNLNKGIGHFKGNLVNETEESNDDDAVTFFEAPPHIQRFGAASTVLSDGRILLFGGFGRAGDNDNLHRRHGDLTTFDQNCKTFEQLATSIPIVGRVFSQILQADELMLISGGRESPKLPCNSIKFEFGYESVLSLENIPEQSLNRWRHTLTKVDTNRAICVGGFRPESCPTALTIDLETMHCLPLNWSNFNGNRHSHASTSFDSNCLVISGGLPVSIGSGNCDLGHLIDLRSSSAIKLTELPEKLYSHKLFKVRDNHLAFVGGITSSGSHNQVLIYDIRALKVVKKSTIEPPAGKIFMLHNFSSEYDSSSGKIYTFGGGGNCFSFGTHLNEVCAEIDLKKLT